MQLSDLYPDKTWPIWLMRQAGRVLPEYRQLRETVPSFWELCSNTKHIVTVTQMPIKTLSVDAAIFFSDILVPLACFPDISVKFVHKSQPQIRTHCAWGELAHSQTHGIAQAISFVPEAIKELRGRLEVPLIGFAGTPWTTALYVAPYENPCSVADMAQRALQNEGAFSAFLEKLTEVFIAYLLAQRQAGAQQLMLFDSWGALCPRAMRQKWLIEPVVRICQAIKKNDPTCPIIYYGRGVMPDLLLDLKESVDVFAASSDCDMSMLQKQHPTTLFQGNIDPSLLEQPRSQIESAVTAWYQTLQAPLIVNLGAGLNPTTPLEHVTFLIHLIRKLTNQEN